jgi:hypothetical protein
MTEERFIFQKILWGVIRRHSDYIEFCDKNKFDENDWISKTDSNSKEIEELKHRFRILDILHYKIDPDDWILSCLFFSARRAVTRITDLDDTNFPETNIRVDIDTRAPIYVITNEIKQIFEQRKITREITYKALKDECVKISISAQEERYPFNRFNPSSDLEAFKVWDLLKQGKRPYEVAKMMWPNQYTSTNAQDKKYFELIERYEEKGFEDYTDKAYKDAYQNNTELSTLIKRVEDKAKRMERLFKMF